MRCAFWGKAAVLSALFGNAVLAAVVLVVLPLRAAKAEGGCIGDCSGDSQVTVNELISMVNVALGSVTLSACPAGDANGDQTVSINEIITGVNNALNGCVASATPTPTPTGGTTASYVGDYYGTAPLGSLAVRFHVEANGAASGFLDFLGSSGAGAADGEGRAADVLASTPASGQANLTTGDYQLSGDYFGSAFQITGRLPSAPAATGTLSVAIFDTTYTGTLSAGTAPPTPTPTPTPGCDSADLQMSFSGVSANFNGNASSFVVTRMNTATEGPAPDYIAGLHETYNSQFNGSACTEARNIQVSIFGVLGGLAAGQSFGISQGGDGPVAIVYYGQEGPGGDSVWSSSSGTVFIDAVNGSMISMRIVGAVMDQPAGAAAGRFTLDVSGHVNNFTRPQV